MKNVVEKKEKVNGLLKMIIKNDIEDGLLSLIENGIIAKQMSKTTHMSVRTKLANIPHLSSLFINDNDEQIRKIAFMTLIQHKILSKKEILIAINNKDEYILKFLIENIKDDQEFLELLNSKYILSNEELVSILIQHKKLTQKHIDTIIEMDECSILLLLIKNKIVDRKMCYSKHFNVCSSLIEKGLFMSVFMYEQNNIDPKIQKVAWMYLIENDKIEQCYIDCAIQNDQKSILMELIQMNIVDEKMCQSNHMAVLNTLIAKKIYLEKLIHHKNLNIRIKAYEKLISSKMLTIKHVEVLIDNNDFEVFKYLKNNLYNLLLEIENIQQYDLLKKFELMENNINDCVSFIIENKEYNEINKYEDLFEEVKKSIIDFQNKEYGDDYKYEDFDKVFPDLQHIGIAYTTTPNEKYEIQYEINLENLTGVQLVNNQIVSILEYRKQGESIEYALNCIKKDMEYGEFELFVYVDSEDLKNVLGLEIDDEGDFYNPLDK